jgi:hypothetical protein
VAVTNSTSTSPDVFGYFSVLPGFFVRCQASHQEHRYARSPFGARPVAIRCVAVASASPSLAYFCFPLTGHFDSLFIASPSGALIVAQPSSQNQQIGFRMSMLLFAGYSASWVDEGSSFLISLQRKSSISRSER